MSSKFRYPLNKSTSTGTTIATAISTRPKSQFLCTILLLLAITITLPSNVESFGILSGRSSGSSKNNAARTASSRKNRNNNNNYNKKNRHMSSSSSSSNNVNLEEPLTDIAEAVNGETYLAAFVEGGSNGETNNIWDAEEDLLVSDISPVAPPLTFQKFMTMQNKRVPVAIRYSAESGLKPYFLTVAKKIKENHPDVILDKVILPKEAAKGEGDSGENPTFEVLVDGKVIVRGPGRSGRSKNSNNPNNNNLSIFVSSQELDLAISRARRRRRPATVYGEDGNVRLEVLKSKSYSQHSKD